MTRATVINVRSRFPFDVYVGRGQNSQAGKWGNPFTIREHEGAAMRLYLDWLVVHPEVVARARRELVGKTLACWCAPRPCHGEVLARLANGEELMAIRKDILCRVGPEQTKLWA